jgi:hypothetical protein
MCLLRSEVQNNKIFSVVFIPHNSTIMSKIQVSNPLITEEYPEALEGYPNIMVGKTLDACAIAPHISQFTILNMLGMTDLSGLKRMKPAYKASSLARNILLLLGRRTEYRCKLNTVAVPPGTNNAAPTR